MTTCSHCPAELEPEDVHDDHELGCPGPPCACSIPSCSECCTTCALDLLERAGLGRLLA